MRTDGRTDVLQEADSRFTKFLRTRRKMKCVCNHIEELFPHGSLHIHKIVVYIPCADVRHKDARILPLIWALKFHRHPFDLFRYLTDVVK